MLHIRSIICNVSPEEICIDVRHDVFVNNQLVGARYVDDIAFLELDVLREVMALDVVADIECPVLHRVADGAYHLHLARTAALSESARR